MNRIAGFVIPIAIFVGLNFHNKEDTRDELRQELIQVCEADASCEQAVSRYFERCFENAYKLATRTRSAKLDMSKFVICINQRSGQDLFGYQLED